MNNDETSAIQKLSDGLAQAREIYDKKGDSGRDGVSVALRAVLDFMENCELDVRSRRPLVKMIVALCDLGKGTTDPIFKPTPRATGGRPIDTISDKCTKAAAGVAMQCWIDVGLGSRRAARRVARDIRKWPVAASPRFNWRTVKRWRDRVMAGSIHDDHDTSFYFAAVEFMRQGDFTPEAVANEIIKHGPGWQPENLTNPPS